MKLLAPLTLVLALLGPLPAQAADDVNALRAAALAATCANCHGTQGVAVERSAVPALAGMQPAYFTAQMKSFKAGTREATVMHQLAKGFTDAQIGQLAAYFAVQKR